jgi:hypothetical protein
MVQKVQDTQLQKFHYDQADRMLLSTYIAGLNGILGNRCIFALPRILRKSSKSQSSFMKQERRNRVFFSHTSYDSGICNVIRPVKKQVSNSGRGWRRSSSGNYGSSGQGSSRKSQGYNCGKISHYARKCPVRKKSFCKNQNNGQGQNPQPLEKIPTKPEGARRNSQSPEN